MKAGSEKRQTYRRYSYETKGETGGSGLPDFPCLRDTYGVPDRRIWKHVDRSRSTGRSRKQRNGDEVEEEILS